MDFGGGASGAAGKASDAMTQAMYAAIAEERQARDQARADIQPWRTAGRTALQQQGGLLGLSGFAPVDPTAALRATPGYQWQLGQGVNALDRSAASRGLLTSGAQQKGLLQYGQGLADQTYMNNYFNPIAQMSGAGQDAAALQGRASMGAAGNIANLYGQMGQEQANSILAGYGAQQQGLGNMFGGLANLAGVAGGILGMPWSGGMSLGATLAGGAGLFG